MKWHRINIAYTSAPFITKIQIGRKSICIVGFDGGLYALSAVCPHAGADLSEGLCVKGKIVCPYHRYTYNLETGKGGEGQNDFVATYPVEIRKDGIYVGIKSFWERLSGK